MTGSGINFIAWWGAILSTLLACIKIWEIWNNRFRIDVKSSLSLDPSIQGNDIFIRNLSSKPIILEYWELCYCSRWWPFRKIEGFEASDDICDIKIEAHSSKTISFREQYYFSVNEKVLKGKKIYIKIYIAGRKPFYKKVYG